jgi:hypothetical protein
MIPPTKSSRNLTIQAHLSYAHSSPANHSSWASTLHHVGQSNFVGKALKTTCLTRIIERYQYFIVIKFGRGFNQSERWKQTN